MAETTVYKPSPGARLSRADAQLVGQVLSEIAARDGIVHTKAVLNDERLRPFFTWDDSVAAEAHRMEEARRLIRSVRVVIQREPDQGPLEVRAFVRIASEAKNRYLPIAQVMSDDDMRKQLLAKALLDLQAFRRRYSGLSELTELFAAMEALPVAKTG